MRPGTESGRMMRRRAPIRDDPSMRAASSSSSGILRKKPRMIQTTRGRMKVMFTSTSPSRVSIRPRLFRMM